MTHAPLILIALGANIPSRFGFPEETLIAAQVELEDRGVRVLNRSKIHKTPAWPNPEDPEFRNGVISVETKLDPKALHAVLKAVERDFGRQDGERNAPRVLDLDLIAYNDQVLTGPELVVPHPRMHQRGFVLEPLCDFAPEWVHPVLKQTATQLFHSLPEKVSRETKVA